MKSNAKIFLFTTLHNFESSKYEKTNSVNHLYLIFSKANGYFDKN